MAKKSNSTNATTVNEPSTKKETEMTKEFQSMCGDAFDNKKNSSCHKMCKEDNPEAYASCLEDFKALKGSKTAKKKSGKVKVEKQDKTPKKTVSVLSNTTPEKKEKAKKEPKPKVVRNYDWFGDGVGTSASMINHLLINGATLDEMKEKAGCNRNRISGHFTGLKSGKRDRRPMQFEIFRAKETGKYHFDHPEVDFESLVA